MRGRGKTLPLYLGGIVMYKTLIGALSIGGIGIALYLMGVVVHGILGYFNMVALIPLIPLLVLIGLLCYTVGDLILMLLGRD